MSEGIQERKKKKAAAKAAAVFLQATRLVVAAPINWCCSDRMCWSDSGACVPGDEFGGRESIFSICHTNEFFGMRKRAPEPTAACCGVNPCRRDYERVR